MQLFELDIRNASGGLDRLLVLAANVAGARKFAVREDRSIVSLRSYESCVVNGGPRIAGPLGDKDWNRPEFPGGLDAVAPRHEDRGMRA